MENVFLSVNLVDLDKYLVYESMRVQRIIVLKTITKFDTELSQGRPSFGY